MWHGAQPCPSANACPQPPGMRASSLSSNSGVQCSVTETRRRLPPAVSVTFIACLLCLRTRWDGPGAARWGLDQEGPQSTQEPLRSPRPPSTTACSLPCPSALSPRIPEEGRPQSHSSVCSPPPLGLSLSPAAPEQSEGPWASPHPRPHPPSPGAVSCRMGHTARLTWPAARREPCASRRHAQARAQRRRKERLGESSSSVKI